MIKRKLAQLMYGRYGASGIDKLNFFLLAVGIIVSITGRFFRGWIAALIFGVTDLLLFCFFLFRFMSRNFAARRKENAAFCGIWSKVKGFFRLQKDRIKDRKEYRYRKCAHCKAVLRLPAKKGRHTVKCPKCGEKFEVNNIF